MANIALDIKANTGKALGEFKKLSRELDNKFLVQGLKLDVVKNAFRQITKEFDTALGDQGFKTSESTNQLQRNAAANLAALNKLGADAAFSITKNMTNSLRDLVAQGEITNEALKETLNVAGFFDFSGSEAQIAAQFDSFSRRFAKFATDTNDAFGESKVGQLQQVLTGKASPDTLLNLDFGAGGGGGNIIAKYLREKAGGNIQNLSAEVRTQVVNQFLIDLEDANTEIGKVLATAKSKARIDDPFRFLRREIKSIFSEKGAFGSLRTLTEGATFENLNEDTVPENVLQLSANLLNVIFNKDKGLFAVLFKSLKDVFGEADPLAPIIGGIKLLTRGLEAVSEYFASPEFKSFLEIFKPLADTIRNIDVSNITIDLNTVKDFIENIGDAIRDLFNKSAEFIRKLDTKAVSEILGTLIKEVIKTIPSLLNLVFSSLGKIIGTLFDTVNSSGGAAPIIYSAIVAGFVNFADKLFGGPGLIGRLRNVFLNAFGGFARRLGIGSGVGFGGGRTGPQRALEAQKARGESIFRAGITSRLNSIIRLLGGQASPGDFGRGRGGPRRGSPGRDGRTARERARSIQRIRNNRRITSRVPRIRGGGRFGRGLNLAQGLFRNLRINRGAYTNPIGPLPLNSQVPYAAAPRGGFTPRLQSAVRPGRFTQARNAVGGFSRGVAGRAGSALGGVARRAGGTLGRAGSALGGVAGRAGGALRRVPLLGPLLAGLSIASILGTPGAKAEELEGLTPEQKREQRRQEERQKTRGVVGVLGGIAGGAAGGAALGSLFGPVGTVIGGVLGGIVGEEAVKLLSDPVIDGITNFGKKIGGFFKGVWDGAGNIFSGALKGIGEFFGDKGPIQSTWRFLMDIPGNVKKTLESGWSTVTGIIKDLPSTVLAAALGPLGLLAQPIISAITGEEDGKFLGGVGTGMTLVGENGPELVNLGSGSVVTPMTSFAGLGLSKGSSASQPVNNIIINVNAPGADEFAEQLSSDVIRKLDEMLEEEKTLQSK